MRAASAQIGSAFDLIVTNTPGWSVDVVVDTDNDELRLENIVAPPVAMPGTLIYGT